jgi:hypothetical protein
MIHLPSQIRCEIRKCTDSFWVYEALFDNTCIPTQGVRLKHRSFLISQMFIIIAAFIILCILFFLLSFHMPNILSIVEELELIINILPMSDQVHHATRSKNRWLHVSSFCKTHRCLLARLSLVRTMLWDTNRRKKWILVGTFNLQTECILTSMYINRQNPSEINDNIHGSHTVYSNRFPHPYKGIIFFNKLKSLSNMNYFVPLKHKPMIKTHPKGNIAMFTIP